ncbi:MAG: NfeD family protein [Lachnospiraceae bacterium]|nr:NfeD family protein [Lachnospiraceae bacterium]
MNITFLGISTLIFWLILFVVLLVVEMVTMGLTTIWFAVGSLAAFLLSLFDVPFLVQFAVFIVVSFLAFFFVRPAAVKKFNKTRERTNIEGMIGREGIVLTEIDNLQNAGRIQIDGQEWSARNVIEQQLIPPGEVVVVQAVSGVKLIVKRRSEV